MGELTVWQQPKWSGRSSGNSTCGQDGGSWPGRAKARFRLAAVNRSLKTIQRGKSWPDLQRPVMAGLRLSYVRPAAWVIVHRELPTAASLGF